MHVTCPECDHEFIVKNATHLKVECPHCGHLFLWENQRCGICQKMFSECDCVATGRR